MDAKSVLSLQEGDDFKNHQHFLANMRKEVAKKHLRGETKIKFVDADLAEWHSAVEKEVVRLLSKLEAQKACKEFPDRIMGSRFVRTRK